MQEKTEKKRLAILRILHEDDRPHRSRQITEQMTAQGHEVSERTVRFYLKNMDRAGLTENLGKKGRRITEKGQKELTSARVYEKVGYLAAKIDQLTYRMNFNLRERQGTVVVNLTIMEKEELVRGAPLMTRVYDAGYSMGKLMALFKPGERVGEISIPEDRVGIGTVCAITVNGVLLHQGVPALSRFGGLLEIRNGKPTRFVELIHYGGTTIDPLEIFIRGGMTDYWGATESGNGLLGASFREVPGESRDRVLDLADKLEAIGLGAVYLVGWPGRPLLEIPVAEGRLGMIVMGGLNPVAILEETGVRVRESSALAGLVEYRSLFHYQELSDRLAALG
jgi:repressor of nif and glnA expression